RDLAQPPAVEDRPISGTGPVVRPDVNGVEVRRQIRVETEEADAPASNGGLDRLVVDDQNTSPDRRDPRRTPGLAHIRRLEEAIHDRLPANAGRPEAPRRT